MAILINDPFGGGQEDVRLGSSKISPRETYSSDPRGIREQYNDGMRNVAALTDALAGFGKAVGNVEKQAQEEELKQTEVLAASIVGQLQGDVPISDQISSLAPQASQLLRARVAETIGMQQGITEAQKFIERVTTDPSLTTPEAVQAALNRKLAEEANRVGKQHFYGPSYIGTMSKLFRERGSALSAGRVREMEEISSQGLELRIQSRADDIMSGRVSASVPTGMAGILALARKDSGNNYNALTYKRDGTPGGTAPLENMTVAEVMEFQRKMPANGHASTALGAYQFIAGTLKRAVATSGIDPETTKFSKETQDQLAAVLVNARGYDAFTKGVITAEKFAENLSKEWAILPKDASGAGSYDGFNRNKAGVSWNAVLGVLSDKQVDGASSAPPVRVALATQTASDGTVVSSPVIETDTAPTAYAANPRALALRQMFDQEDSRYLAGNDNQIMRQRSKAIQIKQLIGLAEKYNDPSILKEEAGAINWSRLSRDERARLTAAADQQENRSWSNYTRAKAIAEEKRKADVLTFKTQALTQFRKQGNMSVDSGGQDIFEMARNADGTINPEKEEYLRSLQETSTLSEAQSRASRDKYLDDIYEAGTTGNWERFASIDGRIAEAINNGQSPTVEQMRQFLLDRKDITPKDIGVLLDKLPDTMDGAAVLRMDRVQKFYDQGPGKTVQNIISNATLSPIVLMRRPAFESEMREMFDNYVRDRVRDSIEEGRGVPRAELGKIMREAGEEVKKAVTDEMKVMQPSSTGSSSPQGGGQSFTRPSAPPPSTSPPVIRYQRGPDGRIVPIE